MSVTDILYHAIALHRAGKVDEAEAAYRRVLSIKPKQLEALFYLGLLCLQRDDLVEAERLIGQAAEIAPDSADVLFHLASTHVKSGRKNDALACYDRAVTLKPDFAEAYNNRGNVLQEMERTIEALASFDAAIAYKPDYPMALYNRAKALHQLGRLDESLASYGRAIALNPSFSDAYRNRSIVLGELGRVEEAYADTEKTLALTPKYGPAVCAQFQIAAQLCDWRGRSQKREDLAACCRQGQTVEAFTLLHAFDDPQLSLSVAQNMVGKTAQRLASVPATSHSRLRIAYLSADFRDHPAAYQAVELFERHDRGRFETYGICTLPGPPPSGIRERLKNAFDHFAELGGRADREIARFLADRQIDIAIELDGYTDKGRPKILSFRPAPIAANYLGYPGTLGAEYVDYIIADAQVIPPECEAFYAERIVRLPDCFMPCDTQNRVIAAIPSRKDAGLPEQGFVFCAFNNSYKISPEMFDIWMRLLRAVEGSVLWLNVSHPRAKDNLRLETKARGVSSERLIFAERVQGRDAYFARLLLADLFLDTYPYGAHATANDMLWSGIPVVTMMGKSFASRVAGSMLKILKVEETIATSLGEYEALALKLARELETRAAIRLKLAKSRDGSTLFDMLRLCRHVESAYETMWDLYKSGRPPESISVSPCEPLQEMAR